MTATLERANKNKISSDRNAGMNYAMLRQLSANIATRFEIIMSVTRHKVFELVML